MKNISGEKILLALLPFWMPLIPPMGIVCLRSYLQPRGFEVRTIDANADKDLRDIYDRYFDALKAYIPRQNWGNFYSVGQDVLRNHLMAGFNYTDELKYNELVEAVVYQTFYTRLQPQQIIHLNAIVADFYRRFESYFLNVLEQEKPQVLGLSVFSGSLPASLFSARLTRQRFPHIKILMGGGVFADQLAAGTPNMNYFLQKTEDWVDRIFIGEGEILFHKYLRGELPDSRRIYTLQDIQWQVMDLSTTDIADFSDLDLSNYPNLGGYTSRSCPFQCSFCSETVQWGKYRRKDPRQLVREFRQLYRQYGRQLLFMTDSLLDPVITGLAEECIGADSPVYWDGCVRASRQAGDPRKTMLWRRGGFYRARLGLESGSARVLELMGKGITLPQIKQSLTALADAGIKTSTLWLIGHPGETEEDFLQTLKLIEEFQDDIYDVEGTPFWYHLTGQSSSDRWPGHPRSRLLYPAEAKEMLITQTWILDGQPSRRETYTRLHRFVEHAERLGIPNPYSLQDICRADDRWQRLHPNAGPPLLELQNGDVGIEERKRVQPHRAVHSRLTDDGNWGF